MIACRDPNALPYTSSIQFYIFAGSVSFNPIFTFFNFFCNQYLWLCCSTVCKHYTNIALTFFSILEGCWFKSFARNFNYILWILTKLISIFSVLSLLWQLLLLFCQQLCIFLCYPARAMLNSVRMVPQAHCPPYLPVWHIISSTASASYTWQKRAPS